MDISDLPHVLNDNSVWCKPYQSLLTDRLYVSFCYDDSMSSGTHGISIIGVLPCCDICHLGLP